MYAKENCASREGIAKFGQINRLRSLIKTNLSDRTITSSMVNATCSLSNYKENILTRRLIFHKTRRDETFEAIKLVRNKSRELLLRKTFRQNLTLSRRLGIKRTIIDAWKIIANTAVTVRGQFWDTLCV